MRRFVHIAALCLLLAALLAIPLFLRSRPPTPQQMMQPEETEWSGVLSVVVVESWRPGASSFAAYARQIASLYEKANPGVLIAIREMEPGSISQAFEQGNAPDVLLFGHGVIEDPEKWLMPLGGTFSSIRPEYLASGRRGDTLYALPIASGGYGIMVNADMAPRSAWEDASGWEETLAAIGQYGVIQCPAGENGYLPAAGLIAATDGAALTAGSALHSNIAAVKRVFAWPDFVLENKYAAYLGTQYDIERIKSLQAGGRAFSSVVLPAESAYTDLVLYAALPRSEYQTLRDTAAADQRMTAAGKLLSMFTTQQARALLSSIRVFPVDDGEPLYLETPGMRELEDSLRGSIWVPNAFATPSSGQGDAGLAAAENVLRALGWMSGTLLDDW